MFEGLWIVQFAGMEGKGSGVIVLLKGSVLGGDEGYIYTGTYEVLEDEVRARVHVVNYDQNRGSVIGPPGNFDLTLTLQQKREDILEGSAKLAASSGTGMLVKLTKKAPIPN